MEGTPDGTFTLRAPVHFAARLMSKANDVWFIRLPDGQVLRAPTTEAVRHHLDRGRIPPASRVRRSPDEEWMALEWVSEFADLVRDLPPQARSESPKPERPRPAPAAPAPWVAEGPEPAGQGAWQEDRMQLRPLGVRGMVEELWSALDSTLVRIKLRIAGCLGVASAVVLVLARLFVPLLASPWPWLAWVGAGLLVLIFGAAAAALLTQMTFQELARARSPRWADARLDFGRNTLRLILAALVAVGLLVAAVWALSRVPRWLPADLSEATRNAGVGAATALELILIFFLGPVLLFALLLGPIVVVEEVSAGRALRLWWRLIKEHFSRVFLYEAMAAALAGVASLPLILPVLVAPGFLPAGASGNVAAVTLGILGGLAVTPLLAYLLVANLFIYLNLRYDQGPRR